MELVLQDEKLLVNCTVFKLSTSSKQVWLKYSLMYGGNKKKKITKCLLFQVNLHETFIYSSLAKLSRKYGSPGRTFTKTYLA